MKTLQGVLSVAAVAAMSCHTTIKEVPPDFTKTVARSSEPVDKLWDLAPAGTTWGMVFSPHAMDEAELALAAFKQVIAGEDPMNLMRDIARELPGETFDALGMSKETGFAMFELDGEGHRGEVWVLPVFAREKFVAAMKGSSNGEVDTIGRFKCQRLTGQYTCMRKMTPEQVLNRVSWRGKAAKAGARGDLEIVGVEDGKDIAVTASFDHGTARGQGYFGVVPDQLHAFDKVAAPKPDLAGATGFATIDLRPVLALAPDEELFGLDFRAIAKAFKGPMTMTMYPGPANARIRAPLADGGPIQALLAACPALGHMVPQIQSSAVAGGCHVTVANSKIDVVAKIDGGELVIDLGGAPPAGKDLPVSPYAKQFSDGTWAFAAWGHGTLLAEAVYPIQALIAATLGSGEAKYASEAFRLFSMIDEGGIGVRVEPDGMRVSGVVRTAWSDEDDVVKKRLAISAAESIGGGGVAKARQLAGAVPTSSFAQDFAAGQSGLVLPSAIGLGLPYLIAESGYLKKSKKSEAQLQLNRIMRNEKTLYITNAAYSTSTLGPTPAATCCGQADNQCHSTPADWQTPGWQELDFEIDEPNRFQYSVKSDGQTVEATAIGDLDCDGIYITYTLKMDAVNGNPRAEIIEPPPNAD